MSVGGTTWGDRPPGYWHEHRASERNTELPVAVGGPPHAGRHGPGRDHRRPANHARWEDLQAIFGTRGAGARCQCQRYRLQPRESFGSFPVEERAHRLRMQTDCGHPESTQTSGLVAYLDGAPVGWCAVAPRSSYDGLVRVFRVPWDGRDEDPDDDSVWAVTCLFVWAGRRRRGVSRALARAAVDHARERGARALEAYPILTTDVIAEELHVGTAHTYAEAGLVEVARPTKRRAVMRVELD